MIAYYTNVLIRPNLQHKMNWVIAESTCITSISTTVGRRIDYFLIERLFNVNSFTMFFVEPDPHGMDRHFAIEIELTNTKISIITSLYVRDKSCSH